MADYKKQKGKVVVISGPSGVGKSTIASEVVRRTGAWLSTSVTTRPQGENEKNGENYFFMSRPEFEEKLERGEFLEHAEVFGNLYGTPRGPVEAAVNDGKIAILEIDVQGGIAVRNIFRDAVMIFILPPSHQELRGRINGRGRGEDEENARRRLEEASREIAAAWQHYDHMVVNENLETAIQEVVDIIEKTHSGEMK